ncbi:uncharacterized protein LOC135847616 isoform X7 [Planococcus citri]|uniref:uncharacterized protein LOC135847616 isoform X7 n=1 Tax=Planococcus citri TaxID=170843 RepID=UPI0031F950BF
MDETVPVVYDIAQPTPVSLKNLSAIAASLEIWRNVIYKHRMNSTIKKFDPLELNISLKSALLPDLPSVIYNVIDEYVRRFRPSANTWLCEHYERIFHISRCHENSVLEVFDDFVADYSGTIDYVRTAKRMMVCDRFSEVEKFAIACTYFFEDDIRQIWPSVCQNFDLNTMDFRKCPQLYYWICCLRNETDKIPNLGNRSVDELMVDYHMVENRPSLEYFWSRVSLEYRMRKAIHTYNRDKKLLVTFVLSKLNDQQLDEFVNTYGCKLILKLRNDHSWFFQPTWTLIKNKMNESTLRTLVIELLTLEPFFGYERCPIECQNWLYYCSEIWNGIAHDLKRSISEYVLPIMIFKENNVRVYSFGGTRFVGLSLRILSSATFEQRSAFWRDFWPQLIVDTRVEDLLKIMKLCFENEEEIAQFKNNILAENENLRLLCRKLLLNGMFVELNDLVNFWLPEIQTAKSYKLQLLQSTFLVENNPVDDSLVKSVNQFNVFIDGSFDDKDQSADFKNQLLLSPATREVLSQMPCRWNCPVEPLMILVDTFDLAEQTVRVIKMGMTSCLTEHISTRRNYGYFNVKTFKTPVFDQFLLWLLGSAEEVERFRHTYLQRRI